MMKEVRLFVLDVVKGKGKEVIVCPTLIDQEALWHFCIGKRKCGRVLALSMSSRSAA